MAGGDYLPAFDRFVARLRERLAKGADAYGDKSFGRSPVGLTGEMEEELVDFAVWGFIAWSAFESRIRSRLTGIHEWTPQEGLRSLEDGEREAPSAGAGGGPGSARADRVSLPADPGPQIHSGQGAEPKPPLAPPGPTEAPQVDHAPWLPGGAPVDLASHTSGFPNWKANSVVINGVECLGVSPGGARKFRLAGADSRDPPYEFWLPTKTLNPGTTCLYPGDRGVLVIPSTKAAEKGLIGRKLE